MPLCMDAACMHTLQVTHTLEGHSHGILGLWLDPAPGQQRAVSGGFDADLRLWDFSEGARGLALDEGAPRERDFSSVCCVLHTLA